MNNNNIIFFILLESPLMIRQYFDNLPGASALVAFDFSDNQYLVKLLRAWSFHELWLAPSKVIL